MHTNLALRYQLHVDFLSQASQKVIIIVMNILTRLHMIKRNTIITMYQTNIVTNPTKIKIINSKNSKWSTFSAQSHSLCTINHSQQQSSPSDPDPPASPFLDPPFPSCPVTDLPVSRWACQPHPPPCRRSACWHDGWSRRHSCCQPCNTCKMNYCLIDPTSD